MIHEVAVAVVAILLLLDKACGEYNHIIYINGSTGQNSQDCLTSNSASFPCSNLDWVFQQPEAHLNSTHYVISEGTHNLTQGALPFQDLISLAFTGSGSIVACTQPETGLAFINVVNITFHNISFFYCAAVGNSKGKNIDNFFNHFQVGLYFYLCESISMTYVSVSHSPNATGVAIYGTNGINSFTYCSFCNNTLDNVAKTEGEIYPGGGGVLIDVTSCKPGELSCQLARNTRFVGTIYTFSSCSFEANRVGNVGDDGSLFPYNIKHNGVGCGGGLSLYIRGNASEITFEVKNSTFDNNVALWGGALFIELIDNSHGNLIKIEKTYFRGNSCPYTSRSETAGGAVQFSQFLTLYGVDIPLPPNSMRNELNIDNCTFVDNWALKGGGVSVTWPLENTSKDKAALILISNSIFNMNVGKLGAAIFMEQFWKISRRQGILAEISIRNCLFDNNTDRYYTKFLKGRTEPVEIGIGTVYVYFCVVNFYGNITFTNNYGTALAISDGNAIFDGCYSNFFNNRGTTGGAITLLGASTFDVGRGTEMMFENNIATTHGGAIYAVYISRQNLLSDATCFIRHVDPSLKPDDWNISMTFLNNTDHGGVALNAIYATSILPCTMVGTIGTIVDKNKVFCWKGWHYSNNHSSSTSLDSTRCHTYIQSDVGKIQYTGGVDSINHVKAFPGWKFEMPLLTTDDYGKDIGKNTIYSLRYNYSYNTYNSSYAWGGSTLLTVPENITVDVTVETIGQRTWFLNFFVDLLPCPPGFVISKGENATKLCQCANSYGGDVTCIEKAREAKIIKNVWMGLYNGTYYTMTCPNRYCRKHKSRFIILPNNSLSLSNDICAYNRKGLICGECRDDYGPAINSPTYDCVQCTNITLASNIAKYIASVYLPLSILFTVLIVFDIRLTTGPANAFILYCQVITSTFSLDADGGIPLDQITNNLTDKLIEAYKVPYGILNLNFIENYITSICFSSGFNTLDILLLQYGVAFFPLLMIVIIVICLKIKEICWGHRSKHSENVCSKIFERKLNKVNSALLPAFAAFLLLAYTKVSITSSYLMITAHLRDENGSAIEPVRLYLAGQYSKNNTQYYYYFIPAVIIFSTFIALTPLLLLDFPLRTLEWLISKSACLRKIYPAGKIHILLDTFQGCYKKNMRFFAGLYFLCRLIINLSHVYCTTWLDQFVIQQLITTVLIALVALLQPYQKKFINYVDMLIFTNLAILNCLSLYLYVFYKINPMEGGGESLIVIFFVQYFLIFMPALYMLAYVLWQWRWLRNAVLKFIIVVINHLTSSSSPKYKQLYSFLIMNIDDPLVSGRLYRKCVDHSEPQNDMEALLKRAEEENKYKQANFGTIMEVNEDRWEEEASAHHVSGSSDSTYTSMLRSSGSLYHSVRYGPEGSSIHSDKLI